MTPSQTEPSTGTTPATAVPRLGELLVERQVATAQDVAKALAFQQQYGGRIGSILVRLGALSEESLLPVLGQQLDIPLLAAEEWPEDPAAIHVAIGKSRLPAEWWADHLVLSTLHTNDAVSAFTRLVDMGVEPFLVATSVRAVQAQRLVRRLCGDCSRPATVLSSVSRIVDALGPDGPPRWHEAVGCPTCQGTGYRGRLGIYELVDVTPELQEAIMASATAERMRALATAKGGRTLREDGLLKAHSGLTTVEEVVRVTGGVAADA